MSAKDPFTIFADELTLLRNDVRKLQRSSLNRDEAKDLTDLIGEYLQGFISIAEGFDEAIEKRLALTQTEIIQQTTIAAKAAAANAIQTSHTEIMATARIYAKSAGEARREAWRYFGGFWVWLTTIGLLGAILGGLGMFWLKGREAAEAFGQYPSLYCTSAGGTKGKFTNGKPYCLFELE